MPNEVKLLPCEEMRSFLIGWLNAFKADPFATGADKVDRLLEIIRPTIVTDEVVERVARAVSEAGGASNWEHALEVARAAIAAMPAIDQGGGDHALPPFGLSQSSLSQSEPTAAIARKDDA